MIVIIFGASGSAGGGVLQACLSAPAVSEVRAIARRPLAVAHAKLQVIQHQLFEDYSTIADAFAGVDACLKLPRQVVDPGVRRSRVPSEPLLFRLARPVMRLLKPFRSLYVRAEDIGLALLAATEQGIRGRIFENTEIRDLADRARVRT